MAHTIGVVGGLGPYAGLDLVEKIFSNTRAERDQDHLNVLLHSLPGEIPVRPEFLLGLTRENPGFAIGRIMRGLIEAGADIVVMPCNTAHSPLILDVALEEMAKAEKKVRFIHIIAAACRYLREHVRPHARVGLMGTVATLRTRLYQDALEQDGFEPVLLGDADCQRVQEAISDPVYGIKAHSRPVTQKSKNILLEAASALTKKNIDVLLLGCTEIPLALTEASLNQVPLVDVTKILARAAVAACDPEKLL